MFSSVAHKGVRVILFDENYKLLLIKHTVKDENKEFWVLPGGGLEKDEYSYEGAIREMKEETGLDIEVDHLVYHVEEKCTDGLRCTNYFTAHIVGGNMALGYDPEFDENNQVLSELAFFSKEEIESLPNVYPNIIRDELWEFAPNYNPEHTVWRVRPSKGFEKKAR